MIVGTTAGGSGGGGLTPAAGEEEILSSSSSVVLSRPCLRDKHKPHDATKCPSLSTDIYSSTTGFLFFIFSSKKAIKNTAFFTNKFIKRSLYNL